MDNKNPKRDAPILIIVICASFTMIVQTIASGLTVMGYDEVIEADAKARAAKILQVSKPNKQLELRIEKLENELKEVAKMAHKPKESK